MKRWKSIGKILVFLSLLLILLGMTQKVFIHKFKYPTDNEDHLGRYQEYLQLKDKTVDVLFLGTSHAMYGISPMEIYKNTGIVSYNMSGTAQRMSNARTMLDFSLRTQSPKVVLLDASNLFQEEEHFSSWRKSMDCIPFSLAKIGYAREYATLYTGKSIREAETVAKKVDAANQKLKAAISLIFPLYFYHASWESLTIYDFTAKNTDMYTKGYYFSAAMQPMTTSIETMNTISDELYAPQDVYLENYENGEVKSTVTSKVYRNDTISEKCQALLLDMQKLCEEHGARLILMKVPSTRDPQTYAPSWTRQRSEAARSIAKQYGIEFFDIQYDTDWEWQPDYSMDGGGHCNYYGARVVSEKIGEYLKEECGVQPKEDAYYESCIESYDKAAAVADLKLTADFTAYLTKLAENKAKYGIAMAANGDMTSILGEDAKALLAKLGLGTAFSEEKAGWSYVAVLDGGELKIETTGNQAVKRKYIFADGTAVELKSIGRATFEEEAPTDSITVDGTEYAGNGSGLNVVVYDLETGCVIDQKRFFGSDENDVQSTGAGNNAQMINYQHAIFEKVMK